MACSRSILVHLVRGRVLQLDLRAQEHGQAAKMGVLAQWSQARGGAALAQQADVAGTDHGFQVGDQPVVVADAQRRAGLVDGPADLLQAHDLEIEVEVPGPDSDEPEQALEVLVWCTPLCSRTTTPRVSSAAALLERDDLADDQLGRVAAAVERSLDEADQVVLDQLAILANSSGQSIAGVEPLRSSKVSLAIRVSPDRLFCTFRPGRWRSCRPG